MTPSLPPATTLISDPTMASSLAPTTAPIQPSTTAPPPPPMTAPFPPIVMASPQNPSSIGHSGFGQSSEPDTRCLITLLHTGSYPMKFEPPEVTRWITKSLLHQLPRPVAQWTDYPRDVLDSLIQSFLCTYRFATVNQEEDVRIAWEKVAGRCFYDYLTKKKELAKRAVGGVADPLQWKVHGPPAIRKDYWDAMCNQWATQEYQAHSAIATQNRAKMPEASLHTSGSITFGCHNKRMEEETGGPVAYTELFHRTHKRKESGEIVL
ncbi:hypothetical protein Taro_024830 [Colocasia esculenta]|uniref:Uncharacterized protein n=1 Tax=Colocasia esculenta TaxID=4460 RepID=A0A843VAG3_COLES|nr:hypothetical protein [Colocasia esculenta]